MYTCSFLPFSWEYPNKQGIGCNVVGQNDTANFLELLKEVRQQCGDKLQLTAAASSLPWNGPDGNPMSNVSEFAQVLDYVGMLQLSFMLTSS
jgi:chitinase